MANAAFEDLVSDFEFLDDWEDRYGHVIELGKAMTLLPEADRIEEARVHGCASQVWMVPRIETKDGPAFYFDGESDAMIVRGLIAILRILVNGERPEDVAKIGFEAEIARLGLDTHLSAQRSNGLRAMVARIREFVAAPSVV